MNPRSLYQNRNNQPEALTYPVAQMKKFFIAFLRLVCIPFFWLFTVALVHSVILLPRDFPWPPPVLYYAVGGLAGGFILFTYLFRFTPFYVFGHEMTHWLTAKLFLKETGAFCSKADRGYVVIKNPNFWIILAPYFVPFYFLLLAGLCGLFDLFFPPLPRPFVYALASSLGLTYSYHWVMTLTALRQGQADLKRCGTIFSLSLIAVGNALFLYLALLTSTGHWRDGGQLLLARLIQMSNLLVNLRQSLR